MVPVSDLSGCYKYGNVQYLLVLLEQSNCAYINVECHGNHGIIEIGRLLGHCEGPPEESVQLCCRDWGGGEVVACLTSANDIIELQQVR